MRHTVEDLAVFDPRAEKVRSFSVSIILVVLYVT